MTLESLFHLGTLANIEVKVVGIILEPEHMEIDTIFAGLAAKLCSTHPIIFP